MYGWNNSPLTPNGKIDRNQLPLPARETAPQNNPAFAGKREALLKALWEEVLERQDISLTDNFFDAGGHSLLLGKLHSRIEKAFNLKFELLQLFSLPTITAQSAFLAGQETPNTPAAPATPDHQGGEDIAIIGLSCRAPGAKNQQEFWRNLVEGVEAISRFSREELLAAGVDPVLAEDPAYVNAWGKLPDVEYFDAAFFGYTPREAELIDPQQRIFLEESYRALEDSGYAGKTGTCAIGVFAGTGMNSYLDGFRDEADGGKTATAYQHMISNDKDFLATRVAYKLNLTGPAIAVQTACSTSLVAVHMACRSLIQGEADMALAGGVSIRLPQNREYLYQEGMILSPDGHCRAFDEQAQGTVGGNGAGVVVLKRLHAAIQDGDRIYAVIKGSAINNDGQEKVGYTAPSLEGQAKVVRKALEKAQFLPETLAFIENHGTGTNLGDPVEIAALKQVFGNTARKQFCGLGSVKTNIGHLDSASGVMGLIKSALALQHGIIPPSLHFTRPNPRLGLEDSPFYVNTAPRQWDSSQGPMRCGVSSFGIGGTNAHVVLEQADPAGQNAKQTDTQTSRLNIFPLSAHSESALNRMGQELAQFLTLQAEAGAACPLNDLSWTLQQKRRVFKHRRMFVAASLDSVMAQAGNGEKGYRFVCPDKAEELIFLFPGQGAQYMGMGRELYGQEPGFRKIMDECARLFHKYGDIDIPGILYAGDQSSVPDINATALAQPLLFTIEYALAAYLISLGLKPAAMLGHSLGEYVCACLAGVFSLEEAVNLILFRETKRTTTPFSGI